MTAHPDLTTAAAYMDEAMKAIALAKQALLGGAGGALFVSSGPDLAAAEASPGNPYGSTKHGEFTAASAAEVAEGVEVHEPDSGHWLTRYDPDDGEPYGTLCNCEIGEDHDGAAESVEDDKTRPEDWDMWGRPVLPIDREPDLCPAQWGEPPETMLCSLTSGHDGNHATAEGIEWGGRWETAEPHGGAR